MLIGFEPFCIRLGHAKDNRKLGILDEYVQKNTMNVHWASESVQIRSALQGHLYQKCVLFESLFLTLKMGFR
jgi:hypothetical protein